MKKYIYLLLIAFALIVTSCSKDEDENLTDYLTSNDWLDTTTCASSAINFKSDGTGSISASDCFGNTCYNLLRFDWAVDNGSGLLTISYHNGDCIVCDELGQSVNPATETIVVNESTEQIRFYGITFSRL